MNRLIYLIIFSVISSFSLVAQNVSKQDPMTLFSQSKFSAAQQLYQNMIINDPSDEIANYYNARCSKELFSSDAVFLYENFLKCFPFSNLTYDVYRDLALLYYRQSNFNYSIKFFLKLDRINSTPHLLFKLAYANFRVDSLADAEYYFYKLLNFENKYMSTAKYYLAYIDFQRGFYKKALLRFKQLEGDKQFGSIVPYYIMQIYFLQKNYKQLIATAKPIIEIVVNSRKAEVSRLLAEAYYYTEDYANAVFYFNQYIALEKDFNPIVYFHIGHSYFKINEFENAINFLERITSKVENVSQYSTYYLGASYLQLKQYNYALQAFKKSSSYNDDLLIQEDAFFNYAKLSYQLDLPFENTVDILNIYLETYDHKEHKQKIESILAQTLMSGRKYQQALEALKNIKRPSTEQKKVLQQLAFFLGIQEYNKDSFNKSIVYFELASDYSINEDIAYLNIFWLADSYYKLNDFKKSEQLYSSLDNNINFPEYDKSLQYNLGYVFFKQKQYELANSFFRKYEKISTDSLYLNDIYLRIADCFFMNQEYSLSEKYYDKAITISLFDSDYALYKRSVALGLNNQDALKIELLTKLKNQFLSSIYYDDALYDLAEHYKNVSNNSLAIEHYDKLIDISKDPLILADAHLSKGMIYFNTNMENDAIQQFLFVVNNFQQTIYFKEALSGLQAAYMSLGRVDEYLEIIKAIPSVRLSESEQDSLFYNAAFIKFSDMDYEISFLNFSDYLSKFPKAIFKNSAIYYSAICAEKIGDTLEAINLYNQLIEVSNIEYQESALSFLARVHYSQGNFETSNTHYTSLIDIATNNSLRREAIIRLMYGNEIINKELSYKYALQVISLDKADKWLISKSKIIIARYEFESGNYKKAKTIFEEVSVLSYNQEGAEAKYYLAYFAYLNDSLDIAEKMIFDLADNSSDDYFIAKSFILLADIYLAKGNYFQAKATLESVIDNHSGEELIYLARSRWEYIINKKESLSNLNEDSQSYIEIFEDEIDYTIDDFSDDNETIDIYYKVSKADTISNIQNDYINNLNKKNKNEIE